MQRSTFHAQTVSAELGLEFCISHRSVKIFFSELAFFLHIETCILTLPLLILRG